MWVHCEKKKLVEIKYTSCKIFNLHSFNEDLYVFLEQSKSNISNPRLQIEGSKSKTPASRSYLQDLTFQIEIPNLTFHIQDSKSKIKILNAKSHIYSRSQIPDFRIKIENLTTQDSKRKIQRSQMPNPNFRI